MENNTPIVNVRPRVLQPVPGSSTRGWLGQVIFCTDGKRYECLAKSGSVYTWCVKGYFAEPLRTADTTASTSAATGALIVGGGVGIAGAMFVTGAITTAGILKTTATTASTSAATGALIVGGGVGIAGAMFITGGITSAGTIKAAQFQLSALNTAPASATATGTLGEVRIDANYIYVCTATNTWKRAAIATW